MHLVNVSVIKMESVWTKSICYVVILLTITMSGVQLQEEHWNFGIWVPNSKTVFTPNLTFHQYENPKSDHNQFTKANTLHHARVNFDLNETGTILESQKIDTWVKRSEKEVIHPSDSIKVKRHVLLNEMDGYSENSEHDTRINFNNITWPSDLGKGSVGNYKNDSVLGTSGQKFNKSNSVRILSDNGSRRARNYQRDFDRGASHHQVNDVNSTVAQTSLDTQNGRSSHDRHVMWSSEFASVPAEHLNGPAIGPAGYQSSNSGPSILSQGDSISIFEQRQNSSTAKRQAKEHIHRNINTGRQQTEDERQGNLQSFHIFERNSFNNFGTHKEKQSKNIWDESDLGINRFSDSTWYNDFGTGSPHDITEQSRSDYARRPHSITARHSDSGRNNYGSGGAQDIYDSVRNLFDYDIRHRDSGTTSVKDVSKYQNSFDNHFVEDTRYSDTGTETDVIQISGENHEDGGLQHSFYSAKSQFGDVRWPSNTDTITVGGKHDNVNTQTTSDSEVYGNYRRGTEKHDPGQDKFYFHRNRFGGITWDSSGSGYHVPEFSQVHEFDSDENRFRGTSWHNEYSLDTENQHVPEHENADGERIQNKHTDGAASFHHGRHRQIATDTPDAVATYTLPNGTRVVRHRRIVPYRKPETSTKQDIPRTFAYIAKGIIQKKVAKFLSLFTTVQFPNEPCQTSEGVNGTCYHHLQCRSLGGISSGSCAQGYGICCYFEKSCGEVTRQNCSYFVNPGFPAPVMKMLACILTVEKVHPDVSQIRLDFFTFELLGPTNGTCIEDQFIVTGQNTNNIAPIICGINTGQHIYMDVDSITGPLRLNMLTMRGDIPRSFRIKVTQIKKGSPLEAPKNCLQYHRGIRGSIESFNYQMPKHSILPAAPGYMNNLNYAICIEKERGYCSVTYSNTAPDETPYPFQLINVDQDGQPLVPPGQAGAEVFNCPDDYIVINGIRLCGERLNDASVQLDFTRSSPVTDISNGPFTIPVRTNANTNGRGFRIDYRQNSCAS